MSSNSPIFTNTLLPQMPSVRGKLTANAPLHKSAWLRVGGPAEVLFQPEDAEDLVHFFKNCPKETPITVLGSSSNVLIRDGGISGVVIRLGVQFSYCYEKEGYQIIAGASTLDLNVARKAMEAGLSGLEFLSGIPGTIGGALRMNAGAHGREVKDVLIDLKAVDHQGEIRHFTAEQAGFSYRYSSLPKDMCFWEARFQCKPDDPAAIATRMKEIAAKRQDSQPIKMNTGGSTFKNPEGYSAWKLIDEAGCRGLRIGGAVMSEKHCNFMINEGNATATDLENLGEEVRRRVKEKSGIDLEWEIKRIGRP